MQGKGQKPTQIVVLCRLLSQDISNQTLKVLSEECEASVLDLSQPGSPFLYSLYIKNADMNEKAPWSQLSFEIAPSMHLSLFSNRDVDVFQWFTKTNIYFLEILFDESNDRNKLIFWNNLERCLCSVTKKISIERADIEIQRSSVNYIQKLGKINDLETHIKNMVNYCIQENQKEDMEKEMIQKMGNMKIN